MKESNRRCRWESGRVGWDGMGFRIWGYRFHGLLFMSVLHARQPWRLLIAAVDQKSLLFPAGHHQVSLGRL